MDVTRPSLHASSVVELQPLLFLPPKEGDEDWTIGHEASDTAITLPPPAVAVLRELQAGATIDEARMMVLNHFHEDLDVVDFVETLVDLGFVMAVDGWRLQTTPSIGQRWLDWISPKTVAWLYSSPLLLLYAALALAGPVLLLLDAGIRPEAHDLLWSTSYSLNVITLLFVLMPMLLLKHELGHLFAARAKGLSGGLTFGHRFIYLVAVSRIAAVWKLRRFDRLLIYSAGMLSDAVFAGVATLALVATQMHLLLLSPAIRSLLALLIVSEYAGVAWEFQIFLKTDVYHILVDLTGRHDLPERAWTLVKMALHRGQTMLGITGSFPQCDPATSSERTDWLAVSYTLIAVLGLSGTLIWFAWYMLPAMVQANFGAATLVVAGYHSRQFLAVLDGGVAILTQLLGLGLLLWSWRRQWRSKQHHAVERSEDLSSSRGEDGASHAVLHAISE